MAKLPKTNQITWFGEEPKNIFKMWNMGNSTEKLIQIFNFTVLIVYYSLSLLITINEILNI
jgi:hypothetical protein